MTADIFCRILTESCGVRPGMHILAAVSGGADSVALLCLLDEVSRQMNICVSCAHVDHGIRGEESVMDMEFVRTLCMKKNIAFYEKRVDAPAYAAEKGCGLEDAARTLRYAFLRETKAAIGADGAHACGAGKRPARSVRHAHGVRRCDPSAACCGSQSAARLSHRNRSDMARGRDQ